MNATTIEQACDPSNWKWKRWDVRNDGMVFWRYDIKSKNKEYWKSWDLAIKEKNKKTSWDSKYRALNKNAINKRNKAYSLLNSEAKRGKRNKRERSQRSNNPLLSMVIRSRCRITAFLNKNGYAKPSKTQEILGCDWNHLKSHMESRFADGMSWENRNLWHIDHIIPLASAKSAEEVVKLCHYTNLQPLWAKDNLSKGAKIIS